MKEKIRPIYSEFQGYLSQLAKSGFTSEEAVWTPYNQAVEELESVSQDDYSRYKMQPNQAGLADVRVLRIKLGGLISRLHGKYFIGEQVPFSGMPSTIITQSQGQSQDFRVEMVLNIQGKIDERISKFDEGSKERSFLQKIKDSLSSVKDIHQLLMLLLQTGKTFGFDLEKVLDIFN